MQSPIDISALLKAALAEDVGSGDITSLATIPASATTRFAMNARADMVASGLVFLPELFAMIDGSVTVEIKVEEGAKVANGTTLAIIRGPARALLSGERVSLNLVQQLSGVLFQVRAADADPLGLTVERELQKGKHLGDACAIYQDIAAAEFAFHCGEGRADRFRLTHIHDLHYCFATFVDQACGSLGGGLFVHVG